MKRRNGTATHIERGSQGCGGSVSGHLERRLAVGPLLDFLAPLRVVGTRTLLPDFGG